MKELSITALAKIIDARVIDNAVRSTHACPERTCLERSRKSRRDAGQNVTSVSTDSRTVTPGDCFFAIIGPNFDGHNFLADAFAKGASCAVVSKDIAPNQFPDKTVLRVKDTVESLGVLASWYRQDCNFKVIAITGSVGKTTTREIIHHVLSAVGETSPMGGSKRFKTFQSPKNFNNFIGLPLTLLAAEPDCQIVIAELGTNHPGEIEYLSRIAAPDIALVTAVAPAHLEGFGNLETLTKEKLSISEGLNPAGTLIINGDCHDLAALTCKQHKKFLTFGTNPKCDYHAENLRSDGLFSDFKIAGINIHLPLPGRGNVENALAAWAVCSTLGISERDFADAVKTISPVSMRTELLQIGSSAIGSAVGETSPKGGLTVINDCYNANPASMKNALDILATLAKKEKRRAVFVCGDMAELGSQAEKFHVELGRLIGRSNVGLLLAVGEFAGLVAKAAAQQAAGNLQTQCFGAAADVSSRLNEFIKDSDIILVKGSRVNKLELVVEKLKTIYPGS
jgi:UDP-N-acetylmuramoyl-tripeptide--D-alanyl-D-alanine ligase